MIKLKANNQSNDKINKMDPQKGTKNARLSILNIEDNRDNRSVK